MTLRDWEKIGELTLSNFEKKNMSSKSIHCAIPMYEFLRFYIYCTSNVLLCISARARGRDHKWAISFIKQCQSNMVFLSWMNQFLNESSEPVIQRSMFRLHWISRFERIVWYEWFSKSFIKTGTCCHLLEDFTVIYLSMTDRNQLRCLHKNTFSKILFNYQYFRPQKKKKHRKK